MKFLLKTKKRAVSPLIWLLIYLIIIPIRTMCYVSGAQMGHVALEVSDNGRCTHTHAFDAEHTEGTITGTTTEEAHCGSCIDLAIFVPIKHSTIPCPCQRWVNTSDCFLILRS